MDIVLKKQLVSVFKDSYISSLKNAYTGYATKTTFKILIHLCANYACIYATEMAANDEKLRPP